MKPTNEMLQLNRYTANVKRLCKPIFDNLDVKCFRYMRRYADGRRIILTTEHALIEFLYQDEILPLTYVDGKPITHYQDNTWNLATHRSKPKSNLYENILLDGLKKHFQLKEAIVLTDKHQDFVEIFDYASGGPAIYTHPECFFKRFATYFKSAANSLIHEALSNPITIHESVETNPRIIEKDYSQFIQETKPKRYYFVSESHEFYLTPMEIKCVQSRYQGNTNKCIARELDISPKTVNRHFENIQFKLRNNSIRHFIPQILSIRCDGIDGH